MNNKKNDISNNERYILEHLRFFSIVSMTLVFFGLCGIFIGIYSIFYLEMPRDALQLNISLLFGSIGFVVAGSLLKQAYRIINKLIMADNSKKN